MLEHYLYELRSSDINDTTKYIGVSKNISERYRAHIKESLSGRRTYHVNNWIKKSINLGNNITLSIIQGPFTLSQAYEMEKIFIDWYKLQGIKLCNISDGGKVPIDYNSLSDEQKKYRIEKMAAALKGKKRGPLSDEHKKSISNTLSGRKYKRGIRFQSEESKKVIKDKAIQRVKDGRFKSPTSKVVYLYNIDKTFVGKFDTVKECAEFLHINASHLRNIVRTKNKFSKGIISYQPIEEKQLEKFF